MQSIAEQKSCLRQQMKQQRQRAAQTEKNAGEMLAAQLASWQLIQGIQTISFYWPIAGEIDPRIAMENCQKHGHTVALPVIIPTSNVIVFYPWYPNMDLIKSNWGFMEPAEKQEPVFPDMIILPLLAFDDYGNRLGYGQGHYDRTLEILKTHKKIIAVGVAYDIQKIYLVPHESHDQRLDYVITPTRIYEF